MPEERVTIVTDTHIKLRQTGEEIQEALDVLDHNNIIEKGSILTADGEGKVEFIPSMKEGFGINISADNTIQADTTVLATKSEVTAVQAGVEMAANKTSEINSSSNNIQYPSAQAVYGFVENRIRLCEQTTFDAIKEAFTRNTYVSNVLYMASIQEATISSPCIFIQNLDTTSNPNKKILMAIYQHNLKWISGDVPSNGTHLVNVSVTDFEINNGSGAGSNPDLGDAASNNLNTQAKTFVGAINELYASIVLLTSRADAHTDAIRNINTNKIGPVEDLIKHSPDNVNLCRAIDNIYTALDTILPAYSSADNDKFLYVTSNGQLGWSRVAAGGATFSTLVGSPTDNDALTDALNKKEDIITAGNGIKIERGIDALSGLPTTSISVDAAGVVVKYAADYTQLPPASSNTLNAIYLVGKLLTDPDYIDGDIYDEYITIQTSDGHGNPVYLWEKIGSMDIDLSNYVPTTRKINDKPLSNDIELTLDDIKDGHEIRFSDFAKADEVQNIIGPHSELEVYSLDAVSITGKFEGSTAYLTQAPIEDNPEVGSFKVVILNYEPAQKYNGYIYLVTADDF